MRVVDRSLPGSRSVESDMLSMFGELHDLRMLQIDFLGNRADDARTRLVEDEVLLVAKHMLEVGKRQGWWPRALGLLRALVASPNNMAFSAQLGLIDALEEGLDGKGWAIMETLVGDGYLVQHALHRTDYARLAFDIERSFYPHETLVAIAYSQTEVAHIVYALEHMIEKDSGTLSRETARDLRILLHRFQSTFP